VIVHNQEGEVEPFRVIRKRIATVHTKHGRFWIMDFFEKFFKPSTDIFGLGSP
jgi:hypothetical protein